MIPKAISMDLRQLFCLLLFFILYVVIGGTVFMILESAQSEADKERERDTLLQIKDILIDMNLTNEDNEDRRLKMLNIIGQRESVLDPEYAMRWGFFNSFFFAITVVTTVGYGHLSPSTPAGRIFCIIYALFGIPMTGILLGAIGDRFSRCFLNKMSQIRKEPLQHLSQKLLVLRHAMLFFLPWFIVFLIIPAFLFQIIENWTFLESFYYCFVTLSTIGFGDLVPGQFYQKWVWIYKIAAVCWIIFGLAYLSMILNFISKGFRSQHLSNVVHSIRRISVPPRRINFAGSPNKPRFGNGSTPTSPSSPDFRSTTPQFLVSCDKPPALSNLVNITLDETKKTYI
ncbi:potassium channel subfamily K member 16 isoform X2 [Tetranychus urticae]|uniref:potassium channel subfamily K member 16 isoform X2 n=1 Tax=Tetranychus urticae TaxID=32264 RepID=UPI00077BC985|nr:potassium channel subfamily K member 16 isoform X2 [Tetranychus urticae]